VNLGQLGPVRRWIEGGGDPNETSTTGITLLYACATASAIHGSGVKAIARYLVSQGADPNMNMTTFGYTPLHGACLVGNSEFIRCGRGS